MFGEPSCLRCCVLWRWPGHYGTYTVDEQKKMLTVNVTGSTFVNQIGTKQTRIITSITPTEMTFTNPAATSGGRLELRFKRP